MPAELWYPAAERDLHDDAGPMLSGPYRGVLHTTESSGYPTYKPGTHPHFTVWLEAGKAKARQHVPLDHAASALMHPAGTVDTNRHSAVQIEIATYASKVTRTPAALLDATRKLMRWVEKQTGIHRTAPTFKPYPASYGIHNGVRLTDSQWARFNGWCGHQHVPNNDHGDPGALNMPYLLAVQKPPAVHNPYPAPKFPLDCSIGSHTHGKPILWLQWALGFKNGHGLDGDLGPTTRSALIHFKAAHGLRQDLIVRSQAGRALSAVHR